MPPTGLRAVNCVSNKWINKEFYDAQGHDDQRHKTDHLVINGLIAGIEQVRCDEHDQIT